MRSHDIVFMENQTIEDIEKANKLEPSSYDGVVHIDEVPHASEHDVGGLDDRDEAQDHVRDQHVDIDNNNGGVINSPPVHKVVDEPNIPLRRSIRQRVPSSRYSSNEYMLLTDGEEPECYKEAMEDEHKGQWIEVM